MPTGFPKQEPAPLRRAWGPSAVIRAAGIRPDALGFPRPRVELACLVLAHAAHALTGGAGHRSSIAMQW